MANVDPSIILGYKPPQFPTFQDIQAQRQMQYRNALAAMQLQQARQKLMQQQQIRNALAQPGATSTTTGLPTANTLAGITRIDPSLGVSLSGDIARDEQARSAAQDNLVKGWVNRLKLNDTQVGVLQTKVMGYISKYDSLVKQGMMPQQARQVVSGQMAKDAQDLGSTGLFSPSQVAQLKQPFNLSDAQAFVQYNPQYQAAQKTQADINKPQSSLGKLNSDLTAGRITQQQYDQGVVSALGGATPQAIKATASLIANYHMAPLSTFAMSRPIGTQIMAEVKKLNPSYDAKLYAGGQHAITQFFGGKKGDTVRSFNVAINHLDTLSQLSSALGNGNLQAVNRIAQRAAQEMGGSAPTNFNAAKQLVSDEIVKAIVGSGGGVQDREEAAHAVSSAQSPQQLKGVIDTYQKLLAGQIEGFQRQYRASTGRDDFQKRFLSPNVTRMVDSVTAEHGNGNSTSTRPAPQNATPSKQAAGSIPKITTAKEYSVLPAGSRYMAPDGTVRTKG